MTDPYQDLILENENLRQKISELQDQNGLLRGQIAFLNQQILRYQQYSSQRYREEYDYLPYEEDERDR